MIQSSQTATHCMYHKQYNLVILLHSACTVSVYYIIQSYTHTEHALCTIMIYIMIHMQLWTLTTLDISMFFSKMLSVGPCPCLNLTWQSARPLCRASPYRVIFLSGQSLSTVISQGLLTANFLCL